jgi:hypothetical protein
MAELFGRSDATFLYEVDWQPKWLLRSFEAEI